LKKDWKDLMISESFQTNQTRISQANSCNLENIFKSYKLNINKYNTKSVCPFKSHKGGRENSASFYFYPNTNSYWCFGCKQGTSPIDFVKNYEEINFYEAVEKILNSNFSFIEKKEYIDSFDLKLKFAELIYSTKNYEVMKTYDDLISKHNLDEESIVLVLNKLIKKMEG
jgi:DNA primase